jgi:hypothetical protein
MSRARLYRGYAADCVRLAGSASSARAKALFLEMAEKFHRLAERTEKASADDAAASPQSRSATINLQVSESFGTGYQRQPQAMPQRSRDRL